MFTGEIFAYDSERHIYKFGEDLVPRLVRSGYERPNPTQVFTFGALSWCFDDVGRLCYLASGGIWCFITVYSSLESVFSELQTTLNFSGKLWLTSRCSPDKAQPRLTLAKKNKHR